MLSFQYKLILKVIIVVLALLIGFLFIAPIFGFDLIRYLSSEVLIEDISQPQELSVSHLEKIQYADLGYDGMVLEKDAGEDDINKILEEKKVVTDCSYCEDCLEDLYPADLNANVSFCQKCSVCEGKISNFQNCYVCNLISKKCNLCEDVNTYILCEEIKKCILEIFSSPEDFPNGCTVLEIAHNDGVLFDINKLIDILKICKKEPIMLDIGYGISKELCYFDTTSVSYYDFKRPSDFYLKYNLNDKIFGNYYAFNYDDNLNLMAFTVGNENIENYRIYIAINGTLINKEYVIKAGYIGPGFNIKYMYEIGKIKTDSTGFGYAEFDNYGDADTGDGTLWRNKINEEPDKNKINAILVFGGPINKINTTFYANSPINVDWTNELRYSNCNFNTNIEPYLKNRPWWVSDINNLNSSWYLVSGDPDLPVKIYYDSSMPGGGNSLKRGNIKIVLGRLDTNFMRNCKFDLYVCSQDAFAEDEVDSILKLTDFFANFNPLNVHKIYDYGNEKIILYNYFEFNLNKPHPIEEISSAIKTGFRFWETNNFLYYTFSDIEWLKYNDGFYTSHWNEIIGGAGLDEECLNTDIFNHLRNSYSKNLIGNCPNNICNGKIRVRVAFKYIKPNSISPLLRPLYPSIIFCSSNSFESGFPFCGNGNCDVGEEFINCPVDCISSCSSYDTASNCPSPQCVWCYSCKGRKWSGGPDRCVEADKCLYFCSKGHCSAECEWHDDCFGAAVSCENCICVSTLR